MKLEMNWEAYTNNYETTTTMRKTGKMELEFNE